MFYREDEKTTIVKIEFIVNSTLAKVYENLSNPLLLKPNNLEKFEILREINEFVDLTYQKTKANILVDSRDFVNLRKKELRENDAYMLTYSVVNKCKPEVKEVVRAFQHVKIILNKFI